MSVQDVIQSHKNLLEEIRLDLARMEQQPYYEHNSEYLETLSIYRDVSDKLDKFKKEVEDNG